MSKLLQILLNNSGKSSWTPTSVSRHRVVEESHSRNGLMENLRRSARFGESMTLSRREVNCLLRLVEGTSKDPFSSDSVLDDGDLKTLGVETKEIGEQYGLIDHKDTPKEDEDGVSPGELSSKQPMFGPESALVAPDCTPGGREDIPTSVLRSMMVVSGDDEKEEVEEYRKEDSPRQMSRPQPQMSRPQPQMSRPQSQMSRPQSQMPRGESTAESASPLLILRTIKTLREESKKQNSRRVIKKTLTEEQKAAVAKLGGSSDPLG
jgi:hypothetical protein